MENSAVFVEMGSVWPSQEAQFLGAKLPANIRISPIVPSIKIKMVLV
jgi:hypothetical protein